MFKKILLATLVFPALLQIFSAVEARAQTANRLDFRERFALQAVRSFLSAEVTFQATAGAGNFGTMEELRQTSMIDAVLASGEKYGYVFTLSRTYASTTSPSRFQLSATPRNYPKSGRRSFYIDETGEMHGADKKGMSANASDPLIDDCASFGIFFNEKCAILDLRTLIAAQFTYQATIGSDNYGSLTQLFDASLINSRLATGTNHDYNFTVQTIARTATLPASFNVRATPTDYGVTGTRSFYMDSSGVIRGADHQGQPADENDPPIQ